MTGDAALCDKVSRRRLNRENARHYLGRRFEKFSEVVPADWAEREIRFLELGCGEGNFIEYVAERREWLFAGVDISGPLCEHARSRSSGTAIAQATCSSLPFRSGTFDLVYANALLHHVGDWRGIVRESLRVAAPSGYALFVEPFRCHPLPLLYSLLEPSERGTLSLSISRIRREMGEGASSGEAIVLPLNTFIYQYRSFPPRFLRSLVKWIEEKMDIPLLASNFMIAARK